MWNPKLHSISAIFLATTVAGLAGVPGCSPEGGGKSGADAGRPELSKVMASRSDLLFRYKKGDGIESATKLDDIPADARGAVQVVDLGRSPDERGAQAFVQVFDLRTAGTDGTFPGRLVARNDLEAELRKAAVLPSQAPVTIYSASWCGVCKKAKEFMREQGIAYVEKDIEKDPQAAADIQRKAQAAGVSTNGVPIFDVGGRIMGGFDPQSLLAAVRPSPNAASPNAASPNLKE